MTEPAVVMTEKPPVYQPQQENPQQQGNVGQPGSGPPAQGGFQQQQGYPAPQQGYPQQNFPQQQGYPPQQGYPQQQGYPPQQGFPPQQPGQPPQQVGYQPQAAYNQVTVPTSAAPGQVGIVRTAGGQQPNDYLILAIIVTLFCCLPLGILGIVKSMEVRNKWAAGDAAGAATASQEAKKWSMIGLFTGIIIEVFTVVFIIIYYVAILSPLYYY